MDATPLMTDRYEYSMLTAALANGTASRQATFEAFARQLPDGAAFGVVSGIDRVVHSIANLRFDADTIAWLRSEAVITDAAAGFLAGFRFGGTITGLRDGDIWFANTPLLTITGSFAECVLLETIVLSALNHGCTIATAAARYRAAAGPAATLIEMGSRRTHEAFAVDAARAAVVGGFSATSNLEAARFYGIPSAGTAAHAWTLAHAGPAGELIAFQSQIAALGVDTTLLVDTYDIEQGIRTAVVAAQAAGADGPGAVRIDSGDLAAEAANARRLLDELGATSTRIVVSGDLDIDTVAALAQGGYVDGYGVGTKLVAAAPVGCVYKLVEIEHDGAMVPVAKKSATAGKATIGGRKTVYRLYDGDTIINETHISGDAVPHPAAVAVQHNYDLEALPEPAAATAAARARAAVETARVDALGVNAPHHKHLAPLTLRSA